MDQKNIIFGANLIKMTHAILGNFQMKIRINCLANSLA
ncbi:hypothetical protein BURPS406E_G0749 [Burkholderia pseudomallei 406e]|uniref:Uncharacterized protein n=1 Tax=Burkholderia pseudomallei 1710a TaxID=320371 RepID=A0A0E1W014_BURPE|nr:hypothetical protein BURPS406E_G0749 [Burkholderia pseudomallei 406e]EET05646.1 hypothetical protein BURPS1710A_A0768 [Burkholderia pseudomallei 1710a]